jgi:hypothetical protein
MISEEMEVSRSELDKVRSGVAAELEDDANEKTSLCVSPGTGATCSAMSVKCDPMKLNES